MPAVAIDAPTGGLNAYDSVDQMPPTDAVVLDNWIPQSGILQSRPGYVRHSTDLGGPVETLVAYKGTTTDVLIAGANGSLLDVTSEGAGVTLGSGFGSDRWQTDHINDRLILVNGVDAEQAFDGTTLTPLDYTGSDPAPTEKFIGVTVFKGRTYYWPDNSTSFWYAQAGGFQGELNEFDVGPVLNVGGKIVMMFPWTVDSGTGPDDMLCIVSDHGELILYQGDDPGNVGFWEQVGKFEMPDPLSIRGHMKYGSDVIIMTRTGYVNLSTVLLQDQISDYPAFSRKIARAVFEVGDLYSEYYGHECLLSDNGFLLFNVPTGNTRAIQYIMNPTTGAWGRFTNLNMVTWEVFDDTVYAGTFDHYVVRQEGNNDNGTDIELNALPAYNYFNDAGNQKHITAAQVLSTHPDPRLIALTGFSDFDVPQLSNTTAPPGNPVALAPAWNTALWNDEEWSRVGGRTLPTTKGWQNVHAFGYAVTVAVQMKTNAQIMIWRQTGLRYRAAGAQ